MSKNELLGGFLKDIVYNEIIPSMDLDNEQLVSFADSVMERFENPLIKHYLPSILLNTSSKYKSRVLSRGDFTWRRDCVTSITTEISSNLIVGETYSPPGLWSGFPLHIHDDHDPLNGESDHEEIYYQLSRMRNEQPTKDFSVQLMFDGKIMNKAYLCKRQTAVAIPGGYHPVVASPVSNHIYIWALGGQHGSQLGMKELPQFAYIKKIGPFLSMYNNIVH